MTLVDVEKITGVVNMTLEQPRKLASPGFGCAQQGDGAVAALVEQYPRGLVAAASLPDPPPRRSNQRRRRGNQVGDRMAQVFLFPSGLKPLMFKSGPMLSDPEDCPRIRCRRGGPETLRAEIRSGDENDLRTGKSRYRGKTGLEPANRGRHPRGEVFSRPFLLSALADNRRNARSNRKGGRSMPTLSNRDILLDPRTEMQNLAPLSSDSADSPFSKFGFLI